MTKYKIQSLQSLRDEMKAVARGEQPAPAGAARPSFNSVDAVVRLLTPENRQLLALIRDRKPQSVTELVKMSGRAQPNLTRTLAKLEAAERYRQKDRRRDRPVFESRPAQRSVQWSHHPAEDGQPGDHRAGIVSLAVSRPMPTGFLSPSRTARRTAR